ncbi:MAG: MipA/OmpV family protein [Alphaproteobacteria bacterium]|nr:MipA/OmpV family protein [Alphaproteobacteria bacterium]
MASGFSVGLVCASLLTVVAALPAAAQQPPQPPAQQPARERAPEGWRFSVGAGALITPEYEGSKDSKVQALPVLSARYRNVFFASFQDGIGLNLSDDDRFRYGPIVRYRFGRDEKDHRALRGTGDRDGTPEVGAYFRWRFAGPFEVGVEARQGVGTGHGGFQVDLDLSASHRFGPVRLSAGPKVSYSSEDLMRYDFGINASQASRSGYARYEPTGGLRSVGFGTNVGWQITPSFTLAGFASVSRLLSEAADSPLVKAGNATQVTGGLFVAYTF